MPVARRPKPLLVGESNPYGGDPYFALYPAPDGCSGHRLCHLVLGMRRADYLREFDRVNLCDGPWRLREARSRADTLLAGRQLLVLCGAKVCRAFRIPFAPFTVAEGGEVLVLPHPSGLCRLWDELGAFARARALVAEACPALAHLLGVAEGDE